MVEDKCGLGVRASTLWGKGPNGGSRGSTIWGRRGGSSVASGIVVALALALLVPVAATAGNGGSSGHDPNATTVAPGLLAEADKSPDKKLHVIVQSTGGVSEALRAVNGLGSLGKRLDLVGGVALDLPAGRVKALAKVPGLTITSDALVQVSGSTAYTSTQLWPYESGNASLWSSSLSTGTEGPAIAVVDSGVDSTRADFGTRVVAQVNLSSLTPNAIGDGRGHGTFVAGIAAGSAPGYAGAAPNAPIVSIRVMDDNGRALTSDVIAACQWILTNKSKYNIGVANFSLHSATPGHFVNSPLDRAVEKLWFSGIFVVAAAGNYGQNGQPVTMGFAPGNDPFVMTVGAIDLGGSVGLGNDKAAPFSAYGYSYDGFLRPDLGAPGRYMVGPVPLAATLINEKPLNVTAPGYIQLSGTSFAAPVVAGAAQNILTRHPGWTPDQIKGALMATAKNAPNAAPNSVGAGEVNAGKAAALSNPPNPNLALDQFLVSDPNGGSAPVFDWASWEDKVKSSATWDDATWTDATWSDATWTDATWTDATWTDATWTDATWTDAAIEDASWEDAAEGDSSAAPDAYALDAADEAAIQADPNLAPPAGALPPVPGTLP
jgi:serine protease AprX